MTDLKTELLQAAARAYCTKENSNKELDSQLLIAIVDEILLVVSK